MKLILWPLFSSGYLVTLDGTGHGYSSGDSDYYGDKPGYSPGYSYWYGGGDEYGYGYGFDAGHGYGDGDHLGNGRRYE